MMQGCPPGRGKSQTFFRNTESIVQERSVTSSAAGGILTLNPSGLLYSEGGVILRGMKAGKEEKVKRGAVNQIVSIRIAILFFFANSCTKHFPSRRYHFRLHIRTLFWSIVLISIYKRFSIKKQI